MSLFAATFNSARLLQQFVNFPFITTPKPYKLCANKAFFKKINLIYWGIGTFILLLCVIAMQSRLVWLLCGGLTLCIKTLQIVNLLYQPSFS